MEIVPEVPEVPVPEAAPAQNPVGESSSAEKVEPGAVDQTAFNGMYSIAISFCDTVAASIYQLGHGAGRLSPDCVGCKRLTGP